MSFIFAPTEGKPKETAGNRTQLALGLGGEVPQERMSAMPFIEAASFSGVLVSSVMLSGFDDQDLAEKLHISKGYMSRFIREAGEAWAKRLVRFMRHTGSLAPLQWLADQMGCDVVVRSSQAALIKELEEKLKAARMGETFK